jgi:hypothetical protein
MVNTGKRQVGKGVGKRDRRIEEGRPERRGREEGEGRREKGGMSRRRKKRETEEEKGEGRG